MAVLAEELLAKAYENMAAKSSNLKGTFIKRLKEATKEFSVHLCAPSPGGRVKEAAEVSAS